MLWWTINWDSAEQHLLPPCHANAQRPDRELTLSDGTTASQKERANIRGCVLLLDEIDKADSELPNSLLEVLANTGFRLLWGDEEIKVKLLLVSDLGMVDPAHPWPGACWQNRLNAYRR